MPTLNLRATVVAGTSNTTWNTTANAVDGTYGTNDATYCNWTNTTANAVGYIKLDFSAAQQLNLPAGALIAQFSVTVRHYESNTSRISNVQFQPYIADTPIAGTTAATATRATTARSDTATFAVTYAQFQDPNFNIRVTATRFNGTTAGIFYIDYVDVSIIYDLPPVASFTANPTTIDQGGSVQFIDTSTNIPTTYAWNFGVGGPASSSAPSPLVTFPTPGTYSVTLTATNAAGTDVSDPTIITVNEVTQKNKIWNGTSWRPDAKIWNGTSWRADWKVWNGTSWQ